MSLTRLMDQTGEILRGVEITDRNNGVVIDWSDPTSTETPCWASGGSTSEATDGRDALVSQRKLYLPPDADITGRDRFRLGTTTYLIDGAITFAARPGRGVHHLECNLKLVEG